MRKQNANLSTYINKDLIATIKEKARKNVRSMIAQIQWDLYQKINKQVPLESLAENEPETQILFIYLPAEVYVKLSEIARREKRSIRAQAAILIEEIYQ